MSPHTFAPGLAMTRLILLATLTLNSVANGAEWSAKLAIVEACCCNPICPCILNSPPTRANCQATFLAEIRRGHYHGVRLDGVSLVVTEEMGKWGRFYVSDRATSQQAEAVVALFGRVPELAVEKVVSVERVPISLSRRPERIRFATPVSVVEVEPLKDASGRAVTVQHLSGFAASALASSRSEMAKPAAVQKSAITSYVQYRSLQHSYHGKGLDFDYSKTHGAAYTLKASGRGP